VFRHCIFTTAQLPATFQICQTKSITETTYTEETQPAKTVTDKYLKKQHEAWNLYLSTINSPCCRLLFYPDKQHNGNPYTSIPLAFRIHKELRKPVTR